jgi:hypothetical protein
MADLKIPGSHKVGCCSPQLQPNGYLLSVGSARSKGWGLGRPLESVVTKNSDIAPYPRSVRFKFWDNHGLVPWRLDWTTAGGPTSSRLT